MINDKNILSLEKKSWYKKLPHIYVILFIIIIISGILTWIIPSGEFLRESIPGTSRQVIVPNSYQVIENNGATIFSIFKSIPIGMKMSADIIFLILISSGTFKLIQSTGAIENSLGVFLKKVTGLKHGGILTIWIISFLFSTMGMMVGPEIQIPFTIIGVSIALGLGYDLIVGLAIVMASGGIGFATAPINMSTIGTAGIIGGLPLFSGAGLRTFYWLISTVVVATYISVYAIKIKKNPEYSLTKNIDLTGLKFTKNLNDYKISRKDIKVLIILFGIFFMLILGPLKYQWYLTEISTTFVIGAIITGIIAKYSMNKTIDIFIQGASEMIMAAFIVGFGRAIQVVLEDGKIMDTIIHYLSYPLQNFGPFTAGILMTFVHGVINVFIPSGSGQAAATMPIMFPLGDILGMTRQTSILAFQVGDGITNIIYPTLGSVMAMCAIARVPFDKWVKFSIKLVLLLYIVGWVFLAIAIKINWGPF